MKKAVIIIPTYNERGNIRPLLVAFDRVFRQTPKQWRLEVLFVDDTSPDGTAKEVQKYQKKWARKRSGMMGGRIHLYSNPDKQGLGKAYLLGMEHAFTQLEAEAVFQFDADLSHDPKKIPELLTKLDQGYDFVLGSRYVQGGSIPADWGWHRKFLSRVGNTIVRFGLGYPSIKDWTTGYRLFTKKVYLKVHRQLGQDLLFGYTIMIGFLHAVVVNKFKVAEVPFDFVDRTYGESKLGLEYIVTTLWYIARSRLQQMSQIVSYSIDK